MNMKPLSASLLLLFSLSAFSDPAQKSPTLQPSGNTTVDQRNDPIGQAFSDAITTKPGPTLKTGTMPYGAPLFLPGKASGGGGGSSIVKFKKD